MSDTPSEFRKKCCSCLLSNVKCYTIKDYLKEHKGLTSKIHR